LLLLLCCCCCCCFGVAVAVEVALAVARFSKPHPKSVILSEVSRSPIARDAVEGPAFSVRTSTNQQQGNPGTLLASPGAHAQLPFPASSKSPHTARWESSTYSQIPKNKLRKSDSNQDPQNQPAKPLVSPATHHKITTKDHHENTSFPKTPFKNARKITKKSPGLSQDFFSKKPKISKR
jgi:hypothetical protein